MAQDDWFLLLKPHKWEHNHDAVGYNFRISNLNAALGCAQLEQLEKILSAKRELYKKYFKQFKKISEISLKRANKLQKQLLVTNTDT